jgi:hypothetical protein
MRSMVEDRVNDRVPVQSPEPSPLDAASDVAPTARPSTLRRDLARTAWILVAAVVVSTLAYLTLAVPGPWFPRATPVGWDVRSLALARGTGRVVGNTLVVTAPDANGISLVTVTGDISSADYRGIAWIAARLPADADVRLLWRSDVRPNKLNSSPIELRDGRTLPLVVAGDPDWLGHITGLALAIHGPLHAPVLIRGVVAKPMGAVEILRDRLGEWFAFEPWNGASINTNVGGVDNGALPLPLALAAVVALAALVTLAIRRWLPHAVSTGAPAILAGFFLVAWLALDARWTFNLVRQERVTAAEYAGKSSRDKHLASEDAPLYAFVEKALAVMPRTPARIFVAAESDYFRGRAAYYLYPHSVYFEPRSDALPPAATFRPGDWILVFQQRGIQFDRAQSRMRWDDGQTVSADLKLLEPGAALFVVR